jgi:hypothetical protein
MQPLIQTLITNTTLACEGLTYYSWPSQLQVIILTCLQAMLAMQALVRTYFCYHATDFDTLTISCLIFSIITVLDFIVWILHNTCGLCISSVPSDESHLHLWVKWQTYSRYFQILCAATPRQFLNFVWTSFMSLFLHFGLWNMCRFLEHLSTTPIVYACNSFRGNFENNIQSSMVCVD